MLKEKKYNSANVVNFVKEMSLSTYGFKKKKMTKSSLEFDSEKNPISIIQMTEICQLAVQVSTVI